MKLLLDGKKRKIYFRKDNTSYYKSNGIENDITKYFKKTGGLKKKYIDLLIENNINKKLIVGGKHTTTFQSKLIFKPISIRKSLKGKNSTASRMWDSDTIRDIYKKLLYIFLICKIQYTLKGKLFSEEDSIYPNRTKKIKTIIDILNGNYFYIVINDAKLIESTFYERIKSICGKHRYLFQIKKDNVLDKDYVFGKSVTEANYMLNDAVYEKILEEVNFRDIITKINLMDSFNLNEEPNPSSNYKEAILQDRNISNKTNLDILKVIMISKDLFKNLDMNLTLEQIQANDPEYCDRVIYLSGEKKKYLEIFKQKNTTGVSNDFLLSNTDFNAKYDNELVLYNKYNALWEKIISENSSNDTYDVSESNEFLYTLEYKNEKSERTLNKTNKFNYLVTFQDKITKIPSDKINQKIRTTALVTIEYLTTTYFNNNFLSKIYNDLIYYYINQVEETIGTKLTTYLSIRNKNVSLSRVHKTTNPIKPKKTDVEFYKKGGTDTSETYTGFSSVFGKFNSKNLERVYNNEEKFKEMKPLFNGLVNDKSAVLIFGYGYSGSGKTYTLFGGSNYDLTPPVYEEGITQLAIKYFTNEQKSSIKIKAIYELYNDEYNIINAVSGNENPYKPFIKRKDFIDFRPNLDIDKYTRTYYDIDYEKPIKEKMEEYERKKTEFIASNKSRPISARQRLVQPDIELATQNKEHITKDTPITESIYVYKFINTKIVCDGPISYEKFSTTTSNSFSSVNLTEFKSLYDKIEDYRKKINHIMPTANNPSSSRGHLFIDFEIVKDDITSYLTICDMGGRENPNDLLLGTKIYNMINGVSGVSTDLLVNEPHIISKDETEMYNYNINKTPNLKKDIVNNIKVLLANLQIEHKGKFRHDKYPGILQLYKSFYSTPSIIDYFYQDQHTDYNTYQPLLFSGMNESDRQLPTVRALSKMTIDQSNDLLIKFYKIFFKCIKQGFYINDSINQLLNKFQADTTNISTEEIKYIENANRDGKCILESLIEKTYPPGIKKHNFDNFDNYRFQKAAQGFNNYGWYTNSLPYECITDVKSGQNPNVYLDDASSIATATSPSKPYKLRTKIYKNSYFQYNPNKITPASGITEDNLAIGRIYDTFGTLESISDIPRKYVVIGCVRDSYNFVDDDKKTLHFLKTVSTSRLTDNIL
tara:strand:- start:244 stop:3714 length:3471 start_codon:yes stop_codon:yes gene_type:complete